MTEMIIVPKRHLIAFWGLIPHQIVGYKECSPYYVCTIPFSLFLSWNLPSGFVDMILKGNVMTDENDEFAAHDEFMFEHWVNDILQPNFERGGYHGDKGTADKDGEQSCRGREQCGFERL